MNIIINNILILIIISILSLQTTKAFKIIKNKNFLLKINGSIESYQNFNKKKSNNNIYTTFKIYSKTKKYNNINIFSKLKGILKSKNQINKKNNNFNIPIIYIGIKNKKLGTIIYGRNNENLYFTKNILKYNKNKLLNNNDLNNINKNILKYKKKIKFDKNNLILKNIIFTTKYKNNINNSINNILKSNEKEFNISYKLFTKYGINLFTSYNKKINDIKKTNKYSTNIKYIKNIPSYESWSTAIKYNINNFYIATSYTEGNNLIPLYKNITNNKYNFINKNRNFNIIAKYNFKSGFSPIIGYVHTINISKNNKFSLNKKDIEKYFNIGTIYKFSKYLYGFINYKIDQLKIKNKLNKYKKDNILSLGFVYKF